MHCATRRKEIANDSFNRNIRANCGAAAGIGLSRARVVTMTGPVAAGRKVVARARAVAEMKRGRVRRETRMVQMSASCRREQQGRSQIERYH